MLQHPFQCLAVVSPPGAHSAFLLTACGSKILSTSLADEGGVVEWSSEPSQAEISYDGTEGGDRPAKKQKRDAVSSGSSAVIKLAVSPDHRHAVAVTEDKIVHVFEVHEDGTLDELSQRAMPKRPCAINVLPDNATILCGDKFGDVYSLPLLPVNPGLDSDVLPGAEAQAQTMAKDFKPSASNTTVHTKRNRKALEAQLKQKNLTSKTKEPLKFEHKLLLGHVSMLTDLTFATREIAGKQRGHIITADRDEHIRVSRGQPQSHIIEGYCLGHKAFVSKVCLVPGTDLLVSGGGDDWIGVWEWPSFKLKNRLDILTTLQEGLDERSTQSSLSSPKVDSIAVSGIWVAPMKVGEHTSDDEPSSNSAVVVACEGIEALLVLPIGDLVAENSKFQAVTCFDAPILDMASLGEVGIITFDDRNNAQKRAQSFRLEMGKKSESDERQTMQFSGDVELFKPMERLNSVAAKVENEKTLDALLYGVANLRKRGYQRDDGTGDADVEAEVEE